MNYLIDNFSQILHRSGSHLMLALVPLLIGLILAVPLGAAVRTIPVVRRFTTTLASAAYTVPSLALFVIVPVVFGVAVIDPLNMIITLSIYSTALLLIAVPSALDAVSPDVLDAADAMGFTRLRRVVTVDMPLALPVFVSTLRVVAVTNISMVSVGALIGQGALGQLFTQGYQRDYPQEIIAGVIAILALALIVDRAIYLLGRILTPWRRA